MRIGDLHPEDLGRLLRLGVVLQTGPFRVRIQSALRDIVAPFHLLYSDSSLLDKDTFADYRVRVERTRGVRNWLRPRATLSFDGRRPFLPFPPRLAMPFLEWGLNWCIANHAHQYLIAHSAVVEKDGACMILPGPPGSGKSTLCAALTLSGWRLFSDELTLLRPCDGQVMALPRPVSLKNDSIPIIRELSPQTPFGPVWADTHKGSIAHMKAPQDDDSCRPAHARPRWVVFPKYVGGSSTTFAHVPRARAFLELASNSYNYSLLGAAGFGALTGLVDACSCYWLSYGDVREAVTALNRLD